MNAIKEQASQADIFVENQLILVHCVDRTYTFDLTVPSLPFLSISVIYCHFSFENLPSERRMMILPNDAGLLEQFSQMYSPCLVRVEQSVIYEVCFFMYTTS